MKLKKTILCWGLVLLAHAGFAQSAPMKWGKIEEADLQMKVYEADKEAEAVVLGEYGEAYFTYNNDKGFQLNVVHHVRIKVLEQEGKEWATIEIPLYHVGTTKQEKIVSMKGITYNLEGGKEEKSKLSKSDIFEEVLNERVTLYKASLPNVKVGSVLEYEYHKVSDFIYGLETWVFQHKIPTRWSEFRARIPEYYGYKNFESGHYSMAINETSRYQDNFEIKGTTTSASPKSIGYMERYHEILKPEGTKHRWVMKDLPAIQEESYTTTLSDYAAKIQFELNYTKYPGQPIRYFSNGWEELSEEFRTYSRFGGELKKQRQVKDLVATITAGMQQPEEKLQAIYKYVQSTIRYNGREWVYADNSFKEVLANKEGNVAEINLLLTAMLREANLAANPVILSTRSHGRVNPVVPLEKDFNYVVAHVAIEDNKYVLLDATDPLLPAGTLPYRCMNDKGRIIGDEFTSWVTLNNGEKESRAITAKLKIQPNGTMTGDLVLVRDGFDAVEARRKISKDGEENYLQAISAAHSNWLIKNKSLKNASVLNEKLEEHYTLEIQGKATTAGDKLYVQLIPEGMLESNPFIMDTRSFPVNFGYKTDEMFVYELELPAGYVVEDLPKPAIMTLPDKSAIFRYSVVQMGTKLSVTSSMQIKKDVYMPEEYQYLKEFYKVMLAKQSEQLVLKKQN